MRTSFSVAAALLSAVATAQTFTSCNPMEKTCPADPALGTTQVTDFTAGADDFWSEADGTTLSYGSNGAEFVINKATNAPTISAAKYIMFGKVTVVTKASPGVGIVSSFILESDDLDEIDWEWLGGTSGSVESNFFGKGNTTAYDRATYVPVADAINAWHTYTIDWTAQAIKWYIDGALVRTLSYGDPLAVYGQNYPQTPMKVKMGSWVGCASAAAASDPATAGTCSWAGGPADFSAAPFTMYVKSVTIEDYGCGTSYTYSDNSGSYQSIKASGGCKGGVTTGSSSDSSSSAAPSSTSASSKATSKATTSAVRAASTKASSTAAPSSTMMTSASGTGSPSTVASTGLTSPSSATSGAPVPTNAAGQLKRMGAMDYGVAALGLGLGYLVM